MQGCLWNHKNLFKISEERFALLQSDIEIVTGPKYAVFFYPIWSCAACRDLNLRLILSQIYRFQVLAGDVDYVSTLRKAQCKTTLSC